MSMRRTTTPFNLRGSPSKEGMKDELPNKQAMRGSMSNMQITYQQFAAWYKESLFWKEQHERHKNEQETMNMHFQIDYPDDDASWRQLLWYLITYPLCAPLYCTMPDVRRERNQGKIRVALVEFIGSLLWIALFSFC